ncbi:MAG: purine-binding chemotaxis protein CheW [Polyangiales bacterium]|jgi:purine-binding chemotaxis protein CheW
MNTPGNDALLTESEDAKRYLTFSIGDVSYAFRIENVTEIIGMQSITAVPDVPDFIKGVINLRGKVIPLMDVRLRLRLPEIEYHDRTCIIVVEVGEKSVGVIVDAVSDVLAIDDSNIEAPPDFRNGADADYISGMAKGEDGIEVILDAERLLTSDR